MRGKRKAYPCEDYEELFDMPQAEERQVDNRGVCGYRMKTITSGNIRECEIYPVFTNRADFTRGKKTRESRDKQRRLNRRNAQKKLIRLLNANFTEGDTWATFTYGADKLPPDEKAAHKFFRNYLRRLDYRMKREAWGELKYIFVTEYLDDGKKIRVHHHCVMNFPDRDLAEKMWTGGARTHTRRLQPDEAGLEGLGRYITKGKEFLVKHARMWSASRNLKQPKVTVSDTAVSRRRAQRMGMDYAEAEAFFQRCNPAYRMTFQEVKFSDDVAGVYLYARLIRREGQGSGSNQRAG